MVANREPILFVSVVFIFLFVGLYLYVWFIPRSSPIYYTRDNSIPSSPSPSNDTSQRQTTSHVHFPIDTSTTSFHFKTNYTRDSFTIVMPTYRRSKQLPEVINHYCTVPHVALILVLWNNIDQSLPDQFKNFKCQVPVKFLIMKENKLTNRFVLYPEIQTEAIYAVDDDRMVDSKGMELGFNAWKSLPHLIVGFCQRSHTVIRNGVFKYGVGQHYTMILTNSVFLHRHYLTMFTHTLSRKLYNFIDQNMNGEDIIMNAMVADYLKKTDRTQCPCVLVAGHTREVHKKPEKPGGYVSLYHRGNHVKKRSQCMNLVAQVFGYMPLVQCTFKIVQS